MNTSLAGTRHPLLFLLSHRDKHGNCHDEDNGHHRDDDAGDHARVVGTGRGRPMSGRLSPRVGASRDVPRLATLHCI